MVLQKRLDYGFNGYQVPATPRATRSARKRCPFKKRLEDNQMCPFDILASLAGKILHSEVNQTNKTSTKGNHVAAVRDSVKSERQNDSQSPTIETCDEGNCEQRSHNSELMPPSNCKNYSPKRSPSTDKDSHFQLVSENVMSDCSRGFDNQKLLGGKSYDAMGSLSRSPVIGSFHRNELQDASKGLLNNKSDMEGTILMDEEVNTCHVEDMVACDGKPAVLHGSNGSAREASCGNHNSHRPGPASQDDVNVFSDDDENSSSCTQPNTVRRKFRPTPQIGDRRIRKVLASKHWNAPPKFNDVSCPSFEKDLKAACCERENYFKRLRCERNFPIKKRKFFHPSLYSKSDGGLASQSTSESPGKHIHGDFSCSRAKMHEGSGVPCSVAKHRPFNSSNSNVKLKIKSFRVPELFIEIPETATVGLLKRTVMEAVTAILRGGLHIGMLLQGKKVKDDNKTLLQTGISQGNQSNYLGFSLESDCFQTLQRLSPEGSHFKIYLDDPRHPNRSSTTVVAARGITSAASPEHLVSNLDKQVSVIDASTEKSNNESKALVPLVGLHAEALAVLPAQRKSKRPEVVQRRIRRPFSVAEVEALVQAVEELGTGRWRDVKLNAFDKAKHRTYVDLKDKWKTLVHTAGISPQQRRGEPVPQELLDRVLTAHAYWSQQQAKQQLKQQSETCLLT